MKHTLFAASTGRAPGFGAAQRCFHIALGSLAAVFLFASAPSAMADQTWNPFAEKDRNAGKRQQRQAAPPRDPRPPLAPMTQSDWPRTDGRRPGDLRPPQPYPAAPPSSYPGTYQPYSPPETANSGPGLPYGAPGTYLPSPPQGAVTGGADTVERGELTPVIASGAALSEGDWQGLDYAAVEQLLSPLALPPVSPTMSQLFRRVMSGPVSDPRLNAVRIAALLKAGHFDAAARLQSATPDDSQEPSAIRDVLLARLELATGKTDQGCVRIKRAVAAQQKLPSQLRGEAIVAAGYCAIVAGNDKAGELAAELARDSGYNRRFTIALLEAIARKSDVRAPLPQTVSILDGLLALRLPNPPEKLLAGMQERAQPGLLQLLAKSETVPAGLRVQASERAAAANILTPEELAEAYRAAAQGGGSEGQVRGLERARYFVTAEQNQAQFSRTRDLRALLDSARRDSLYYPVAAAAKPIVAGMRPAQEISWFGETAIEILAAGGDYAGARQWASSTPTAGGGSLNHWLMLLDIADAKLPAQQRGQYFRALEDLAARGRFTPVALHRLATVLDALDYNVPIPLWNLASRTEQPQTGHLPETGFLSAMKKASESKQLAATMLYAMRTIAPQGTGATHLLGLGDTIRALKRVGLEDEARRLAFEALFGDWPRGS